MKKLAGFLLSYICYYIGDAFCRLSMVNLFDRPGLAKTGMWLAHNYQRFMRYSLQIQDWTGNETPWKKINNLEGQYL